MLFNGYMQIAPFRGVPGNLYNTWFLGFKTHHPKHRSRTARLFYRIHERDQQFTYTRTFPLL